METLIVDLKPDEELAATARGLLCGAAESVLKNSTLSLSDAVLGHCRRIALRGASDPAPQFNPKYHLPFEMPGWGGSQPRIEAGQRMRGRICPISGPGKLSASERKRKAKEIITASGADTAEHFETVVRSNHGITFREQAEIWLEQMKNRKRKPVAPSTFTTWECCLENWLNPHVGHMPLDRIKNLALKNLGIKMVEGGLGESAIRSYANVVKMVVASVVNEEGEELYPRNWNHSFIDLPRIGNQKQPSFKGEVVTRIVASARKEKYRLFFALSGGTGLRFGETLGIKVQDISPDCSTIKIVQKAWRSQIHNFLKTDSGSREIDLCPALASMVKEYLDKRQGTLKSDLLFQSKSGKPLQQSNVLRRTLHPILRRTQ
jgi:integrase